MIPSTKFERITLEIRSDLVERPGRIEVVVRGFPPKRGMLMTSALWAGIDKVDAKSEALGPVEPIIDLIKPALEKLLSDADRVLP